MKKTLVYGAATAVVLALGAGAALSTCSQNNRPEALYGPPPMEKTEPVDPESDDDPDDELDAHDESDTDAPDVDDDDDPTQMGNEAQVDDPEEPDDIIEDVYGPPPV